jgi:hypothetical protein
MPESKPFERLPKSVVPKHYDLQIKPDLKLFIFEGQETVKVEVSNWQVLMSILKTFFYWFFIFTVPHVSIFLTLFSSGFLWQFK